MGIVRPTYKNTPRNKGGCDNGPSITTLTSNVNSLSNLAPTCAFSEASDIKPQQQCASSVTGVKSQQSYVSVPERQCDCTQQVSNVCEATYTSGLVNKAVSSNPTPLSCPNLLQLLSSLQQSPEHPFQLSKLYPEQRTLPYYAQKQISSPIAGTYSKSTEPQNLNLCSPHLQSTPSNLPSIHLSPIYFPSMMEADVKPMTITPISSLSKSSLSSDTEESQVIFPVGSKAPTKTTIVQNKDNLEISSSAVVFPEKKYGNIEIVNTFNSNDKPNKYNAIDEHAIALDANSGTANSQWPVNLIINVPPVNVPAPSVTFLPAPSSSPAPSFPSRCAPAIPQFDPTPLMPIIVGSSKSKLRSLLPIILISLLREGGGGSSCNCGCRCIPIPYPIPIPTNYPINNTSRGYWRKSRNYKNIED